MNKKYLQFFLGSTILLFIYSLIHRIPDVDDGWIGDLAYFQAKLGYAKSELMRGITMLEIRHVCHHKFLTIQGGWFVNLFGWSLYTLKSVSLMYLIIFISSFCYYAKSKSLSQESMLLFFSLLLSNALIFEFSFIYRPELPVMAIGFLSFIFLEKSLEQQNRILVNAAIAGLFAGLCVATHLNGIVFPISGFLLLAMNKKFLPAFIFGIFTLPTIAIYFYDFRSMSDFALWSYQMNNNPSIDTLPDMPLALKFLNNILSEHKRFFHSPIEVSFSILMIVVFAFSFKKLKQNKTLLLYSLILIVTLTLFSVHKSSKYAIIYLPYLMLLVTYGLQIIYDKRNELYLFKLRINHKFATVTCTILLLFYFSANSFFNIRLCSDKFYPKQNSDIVKTYIHENTHDLRIVAPMTFIFNEIDSFKSIQGEMYYTEMQKKDTSLFQSGFLQATKKFHIDYILLSPPHIELLGMNNCPNEVYRNSGFELLSNSDKLLIIKRIK